jgi:hypothetical protein
MNGCLLKNRQRLWSIRNTQMDPQFAIGSGEKSASGLFVPLDVLTYFSVRSAVPLAMALLNQLFEHSRNSLDPLLVIHSLMTCPAC